MKDQKVLDIVQEKLEKGENVLIYVNYVNKTECVERLERILKEFNIKTCVLDASISASRREEWIDKKVKEGYRVLICNPTLVETGLDLLAFTNIIFYQVGYNLFTMRQASRRSLRLNQPNDVNVYFLYYAGTTQEAVLSLMANKLQASMAIEGKFTEEGLNAMSNNDSILTQIAESLVQNIEHKVEIGTFSSGIGRPEDDDGSRFKLIDMIMNKKKKELVYSFVKSCNKKKVVKTEFGIKNGKMKLAV
jgi:SNF2 family DNA or RNA helicase